MIHEASGGLNVFGCSAVTSTPSWPFVFQVGSRVYISKKAKKGILEFVVLKRRRANRSINSVLPALVYVDTFNRVWLEDELMSEAQAVSAAEKSLKTLDEIRTRNAMENCISSKPSECD